ncbi:hypothetical protein BE08_20460 [Sorangium cellulosum]|uniref:Uncharacterized protein n=1 Tax=Sorangium cellulosum TaxID=56 RepID=A0A150PQ37_SORCE|nr:hypothetical protein BE08_20460 [Sorangium cellulosum]
MLRLGLDLYDPETAEIFVEGVRAADESIAEDARRERSEGRSQPPPASRRNPRLRRRDPR